MLTNTKSPVTHSIYRAALKDKISISQKKIRQDILSEQIKVWRRTLPLLLHKLSRIPDTRRPKSIKHKMVVLMIFGLLAFVFRLSSRREMNRELTASAINHHLQKIFPELDSIPHADTLPRLLGTINVTVEY